MASRAKWLLCALTCLAAVLTAATLAQAVEQFSKNGCFSPVRYAGSVTTPSFTPAGDVETGPDIAFRGWFEIESVAPGGFDQITVEYSTDPGPNPRTWLPVDIPNGDVLGQSTAATPGGPDVGYSNNGTATAPSFQDYVFNLPPSTINQPGVQVRITFDTLDETYQGFRGVGIDNLTITGAPGISEGFETGASGWTFDPAGGPGDPFWQILDNPETISIKSPEINPDLVTLFGSDTGNLPAADTGTGIAWFGNVASGTFCGPDFGLRQDLSGPDTTITSGPPASTASKDATFAFTATEQAVFQCQLDGGEVTFCASPQTYSDLSNGTHTFTVFATDINGNVDPTPATYSWTVRETTLGDLDNPTQGVDVNVDQVAGTVLVGVRGAAAGAAGSGQASQKGITFVPLTEARQVPVGSFLDTRRGTVRLQSAQNRAGKRQTGTFFSGLFQVRQSRKRSARGLTDLVLKGSNFRRCRAGGSSDASAAGVSSRQIRRLRANARGRFRTRGRNSSATVRGTNWGVIDRCDGTLTTVRRGRVVVRDFRRKRNIVLTAGKSYLAKAPG